MILRPVSPASPIGPPISKRPVGLTSSWCPSVSRSSPETTGAMTCSATSGASSESSEMSGACWLETTTVSSRAGRSPSYSMVTWVLPSGRRYGTVPSLRTSVRRWESRCAKAIGSGISSGVSRQAKPNIRPWSPAPWRSSWSRSVASTRDSQALSTPWAMSGLCPPIETLTPHEAPSKPFLEES